jgi:CubicO group peptidase (beta-lactamase class C family)
MVYCIMAFFILSSMIRSCEVIPSNGDTETETVRDPRFEVIDAAVEADLAQNAATSASVAVWLDGEIVWVGGYGTADPLGDTPPDEDTLFLIGSDTKKITAISLLGKVASGKLTMDTTIKDVLPGLEMQQAPVYETATIHQLLSHQGGIVDGGDTTSSTTDAALHDFAFGEFAESYYALAPPGVFFNYSNPNFAMAGLIDETLDCRMWPDIVTEDIFIPLGMTRTVARKSEVDDNVALGMGLMEFDGELQPISLEDTIEGAFTRPAGLVWSTPGDQMRLARFLVEGNNGVLCDQLRAEISSPQTPIYPDNIVEAGITADFPGMPNGSYGYGLFIQQGLEQNGNWYDIPVWGHGGNTHSHTSTFVILPEQKFAISILSNGVGDNFRHSVRTAIEALVTLPPPTTRPVTPFDSSVLGDLTGTYIDPYEVGEVIVSEVGDGLQVELPMFDMMNIPYNSIAQPVSTHVWRLVVDGEMYAISFVEGPDGEQFIWNRGFVAQRVNTTMSFSNSFMVKPLPAFAPRQPLSQLSQRLTDALTWPPLD